MTSPGVVSSLVDGAGGTVPGMTVDEELAAVAREALRYSRALARAEQRMRDRDAAIIAAYDRGASLRQIAEAAGGMTRQNVLRVVKADNGS